MTNEKEPLKVDKITEADLTKSDIQAIKRDRFWLFEISGVAAWIRIATSEPRYCRQIKFATHDEGLALVDRIKNAPEE